MNRPPRGLSEEEQAAWARLAASVTPMDGRQRPELDTAGTALAPKPPARRPAPKLSPPVHPKPTKLAKPALRQGLDGNWERKLSRAGMAPDFTLDLHGLTLDAAYQRLNRGMAQAIAQDARLLLVIAGKPRPTEAADRGSHRGAIRAKLLDWIAAGPHSGAVAAVRPAHRRHGGAGALYIVLKRTR